MNQERLITDLQRQLAEAKGFGELINRLYNDLPLSPCSEYSQDVAFLVHCFDSWRKEANERAKQLAEAQAAIWDVDILLSRLGLKLGGTGKTGLIQEWREKHAPAIQAAKEAI